MWCTFIFYFVIIQLFFSDCNPECPLLENFYLANFPFILRFHLRGCKISVMSYNWVKKKGTALQNMDELKKILLWHRNHYPKMEPTDAVKLIYQNEFGSGHMIRDESSCMSYLRREYETTPRNFAAPTFEDIGNGIVRIHLAPLKEENLEQLCRDFIRCSGMVHGTLESFLRKLDVLKELTRDGYFPFTYESLEEYLASYGTRGYPPVSHSDRYRAAYNPAYRIVKKE